MNNDDSKEIYTDNSGLLVEYILNPVWPLPKQVLATVIIYQAIICKFSELYNLPVCNSYLYLIK